MNRRFASVPPKAWSQTAARLIGKYRDDAISATKAAVAGGIVPGGGLALLPRPGVDLHDDIARLEARAIGCRTRFHR
jgi:hypothetical protein